MGIKGFSKAMKELAPTAFGRISASEFRGKRVAIDTPGIAWRILAVGHRKAVDSTDVLVDDVKYHIRQKFFLSKMMELVKKFLRLGIVPVFIMEGEAPPEKADNAWVRRSKSKDSLKRRLDEMTTTINNIHISEHTQALSEAYKKLLRQDVRPKTEEFVALYDILTACGIPCINAAGEAERLCVSLALEGHVEGIYTKDTDIFPMGCQLMLTDLESTPNGYEFLTVSLGPILNSLELRFDEFVDLCIMSECDFNKNMPGYALKKSYKLLLTHRRIENLPDKFDTTILNYVRCRELFAVKDSKTETAGELIFDLQQEHLTTARETLTMYGVDYLIEELLLLYGVMPDITSRGYTVPPSSSTIIFTFE